jgi:hypothetical protein
MLRDTDYLKMANEYSTSIGMATWIDYQTKEDFVKKSGRVDDATINEMVALSVEEEIYPKFIRKVYELQMKRRGNIKDSTIYKRAYQLCK